MTMTNREKSDLLRELHDKHPPDIARAIYNATVNPRAPAAVTTTTTPPTAAATPLAADFKKLDAMNGLLNYYGEPDKSLAVEFVQQGLSPDQARQILLDRQRARQWKPFLREAQRYSTWGLPADAGK